MEILRKEHGFDEPLGLLSDCHRRIEHHSKAAGLIEKPGRHQEIGEMASRRGLEL